MISVESFKALLQSTPPQELCRKYLFSNYSWMFDQEGGVGLKGDYQDFRKNMASFIGEPLENIAVVGSAKYGFSLSPDKNWKPFDDSSDIDVVIVSDAFFNEIWTAYRLAYYNGYLSVYNNYSKDIFKKFVVVHLEQRPEYKSKYLRDIWLKVTEMQRRVSLEHRISHPIKFRVYSGWGDVEYYHIRSFEYLKENANGTN